jgi:hypothetical protein
MAARKPIRRGRNRRVLPLGQIESKIGATPVFISMAPDGSCVFGLSGTLAGLVGINVVLVFISGSSGNELLTNTGQLLWNGATFTGNISGYVGGAVLLYVQSAFSIDVGQPPLTSSGGTLDSALFGPLTPV